MRSKLLLSLPLALLFASVSLAAPPNNGGKPVDTLRELKTAFARNDRGGEWATLSPGFKRRLSRQAGRNVDVGDYIAARNAYRNDPRIKELETWMPSAKMTHMHMLGGGRAKVTLRFGTPLLIGKTIDVFMINHSQWELRVRGEAQPFWGFEGDRGMQIFRSRDGATWTVRTLDTHGKVTWTQSWPASRVVSYTKYTKWYFDGFGSMEAEFMKGIK